MKVVAYVHPDRVGGTETGVAKHIREMILGLHHRPGIDLMLMAPRKDWQYGERRATPYPFDGLPRINLPGRRKWLEKVWAAVNAPAVDRWCPGADWVYCPMEAYVPVRKPRLAVTAHGMEWFEPDAPWYADCHRERARWRFKFGPVLRKEDALILAVSEFMKRRLVELFGVRPERVEVVGNGVEPAFFAAADTPVPEGGPRYVLVVGGLQTVKGGDRTLAVADELRRRGSDVQVWVIGLSAAVNSGPAHPQIRRLGFIGPGEGLPDLLRKSVALLFLSRYESFGIPAAEAMAAGTPAIVSQNGALPEVVGQAGLVIDADDPAAVADAITAVADDRSWRADRIARGRERAKELTWDRCLDRLLAALSRSA
jgi:glycosyltransferase involved in cell wall biosynthesis